MTTFIFVGQIVHSISLNEFEVLPNGFVAVRHGKIVAVGSDYATWKMRATGRIREIFLLPTQFLMPGLIDCHIHAPQMTNMGLGMDKPLLEWLEAYTFPTEAKYSDIKLALQVYERSVQTTLRGGTTLAAYFATNHKNGSIVLAKEAIRQGQRALIGKVSADCGCPSYYVESYEEAIREAHDFVDRVLALKSCLAKPIITPRFALSCSESLMKSLGKLAKDKDLHIQTHISENKDEVVFVQNKFDKAYAHVYNDTDLLSEKTILAHAVHLSDAELQVLKKTGTAIAHCPASNTNLKSGMCNVRRILNFGIKVGLGTDVSGGHSPSIINAMLHCLNVSNHIIFAMADGTLNSEHPPALNYQQAFYLATLGGAEALSMDDVTGNFIPGKSFDALIIDTANFPIFCSEIPAKPSRDELLKLVQKFVYSGDDRNIIKVYVEGRRVK